jgi:hypothetical protein
MVDVEFDQGLVVIDGVSPRKPSMRLRGYAFATLTCKPPIG